jgi:hypothetical protein
MGGALFQSSSWHEQGAGGPVWSVCIFLGMPWAHGSLVIFRIAWGDASHCYFAAACLHAAGMVGLVVGGSIAVLGLPDTMFGDGWIDCQFYFDLGLFKEVNPPMLSGIATSVVNVGVFLGPAILQPLVGWVMDLSWQSGVRGMHEGVRQYAAADFQAGIGLMAGAAFLGCLASLGVHETGCRNVWKEPNV